MKMKSKWIFESKKLRSSPSPLQSVRSVVFGAAFGAVLALGFAGVLSATASAQDKPAEKMDHSAPQAAVKAPPTETEKAFDKLKTLAGAWEGTPKVNIPVPDIDGKPAHIVLRVASRGHTLMHDLKIDGIPDNPLTMIVVDADRLLLTHYCDADNRPRMVGKISPDGKTVEFDFIDISGHAERGHMHHAVFNFVDENHHSEEWTFMMPGDKPVRVHFDLQRANSGGSASGK
jgi:hypothetical protein